MDEPKRASTGNSRTKVTSAQSEQEGNINRHWRTVFLAALAETSNVTAAAAAAQVHPSRAYKVRRSEPGFAREWRSALLEGYELLEMEVLHRMRFGDPKEGERKFDNATALRLLGLHRETVAQERAIRENDDVAAVRASIDAKLAELRGKVMARRIARNAASAGITEDA
jgi:hypothetical protein